MRLALAFLGCLASTAFAQQIGSDDCQTPTPVVAVGLIDLAAATTGAEGQNYSACLEPCGSTTSGMDNDVWFLWTAPSDGVVDAFIAAPPPYDFKLAVYAGNQCAASPPIACSDDGVGAGYLDPWLTFEATAGLEYLFQAGAFPGTPPGSGHFVLDLVPLHPELGYALDRGESDYAWSPGTGSSIAWIQRYDAFGRVGGLPGADTIHAIWAAFGVGSSSPALGDPFMVHLWDDPNDDGRIDDAVLLASAHGQVAYPDSDTPQRVLLPQPTQVSGMFFVGVSMLPTKAVTTAPVDESVFPSSSFLAGNNGPFDPNCLACNASPPTLLRCLSGDGAFLLRAEGLAGLVRGYCLEPWAAGACETQLLATGVPSLAASTFHLIAERVASNRPGILIWSLGAAENSLLGSTLCLAAPIKRTAGQLSGGTQPPGKACDGMFDFDWSSAYMSLQGIPSGTAVFGQYWNRDPGSATSSTLSTALAFVVVP